jgi:hypothetical protein
LALIRKVEFGQKRKGVFQKPNFYPLGNPFPFLGVGVLNWEGIEDGEKGGERSLEMRSIFTSRGWTFIQV